MRVTIWLPAREPRATDGTLTSLAATGTTPRSMPRLLQETEPISEPGIVDQAGGREPGRIHMAGALGKDGRGPSSLRPFS